MARTGARRIRNFTPCALLLSGAIGSPVGFTQAAGAGLDRVWQPDAQALEAVEDVAEPVESTEVPAPPDRSDDASDAGDGPPAADPQALIAAEKKRAKAEALIAELADADDAQAETIERELAELGEASLVPLKLAALSDDFDLRTRAGAMGRRLRWRLVSSDALLKRLPELPGVMAGEAQAPRRQTIDALVAEPTDDLVPLFVECLADRDAYIRERGIDGLVKVGTTGDAVAAGRALERAALNSDDKSVVLLAVAGLGEIDQVDIEVLTRLFEATEHAEVQRTVLMTAGYSGQSAALGLIGRALNDPRWRVRAAGLEALEDVSRDADKAAVGRMVRPLLDDPEPFIRASALRLTAELKLPGTDRRVWELIEAGKVERAVGLETLASLQDTRAFTEIRQRYDDATEAGQHEDAVRWLAMMNAYRNRGDVDVLLKNIIEADKLREQWTTAIYLASRRSASEKFVPLVAPMLLDEDHAVRKAVWDGFGRYDMDSYTLPEELDRGLATGDTEQRLWRLSLIYQRPNGDLIGPLSQALGDDQPAVASRALALIASLTIDDSLGEDRLPYRSTTTQYEIDPFGNHARKPPAKHALSDEAVQQVRAAAQREDPVVRARAAALLYYTGKDRGEKVVARLKAALASGEPAQIAPALLAARAEPGALTQGIDLLALTREHKDVYLLKNACCVMVNSGDQKLVDAAIGLSESFEFYAAQDYFVTLAATGSEPAIELTQRKLLEEGGYYAGEFIQSMVRINPDIAIQMGTAVLESPRLDQYDRRGILNALMQTKSKKLIPLLKAQIKRQLASNDRWERQEASRYRQLLLQIDPESVKTQIGLSLEAGNEDEQAEAVASLLEMPASDALAEMVLEAALERDGGFAPAWAELVQWAEPTGVYPRFEASVSELPAPLQRGLVEAWATREGTQHLDKLLSVEPADKAVRERVAMVVAELTTKHPGARPDTLDALQPPALVYLLSAAGQWPGGEASLGPWLDHNDAEIAEAAHRGLAIARLLSDDQTLSDADAQRLSAAVASDDPATAYLAAEALYQLAPDRLVAIDTAAIRSDLALLRIGCAGGGGRKGPVADAMRAKLNDPADATSTAKRFALLATINTGREFSFLNAWQSDSPPAAQADLLARALHAFDNAELLEQAAYHGSLPADDPKARAMVQRVVAQSNGQPSQSLGKFLQLGLVERVEADRVGTFLSSLEAWGGGSYSGVGLYQPLIAAVDQDDPALKQTLIEQMEQDATGSFGAAVLAYTLYRDERARRVIAGAVLDLDPQQIERGALSQQAYTAVTLLPDVGRKQDVPELVELYQGLAVMDEWQARMLRGQLLRAAVVLDPDQTRRALARAQDAAEAEPEPQTPAGFQRAADPAPLDALSAMLIDRPADEQVLLSGEPTPLTARLREIKAGNLPGGRLARPPWDASAGADDAVLPEGVSPVALEVGLTLQWVKTGVFDRQAASQHQQAAYSAGRSQSFVTLVGFETELLQQSGWNFRPAGVMFNDPASVQAPTYYAALGQIHTLVPLSEQAEEAIQKLGPLLADDDPAVASRAARAAALWRATSLRDPLMAAIARADDAGVEAAWAAARLFGPGCVDAVRARAKAEDHYGRRVELACVLALLGESAWSDTVITDARRLLAIQQLRGRAVEAAGQQDRARRPGRFGANPAVFGREASMRPSARRSEPVIDGRLPGSNTRWSALLGVVSGERGADRLHRRLDLADAQGRSRMPGQVAAVEATDGPLELDQTPGGGLTFTPGATHGLPIPSLVGPDAPLFAHADQYESALFRRALTLLAEDGMGRAELGSAWHDWIEAHGEDAPDTLWRQGVADAIGPLTDAKWWRRALARERLQRLTGRAIDTPALFDMDAWASLQTQWRGWAASQEAASPRSALAAAALDSGIVASAPTDAAQELEMLVRMAGWGSDVQSRAALHRLDLWPDGDALLKAAAAWQTAPRSELRAWYLQRATTRPMLYAPASMIDRPGDVAE